MTTRSQPLRSSQQPFAGFTLIELLAVVVIIGLLTQLGIGPYRDAVDRARVAKATGDLKAILVDLQGRDSLPSSLAQIGRGTLLDPWGHPYVYYPFPPTKGKAPPGGARRDRFLVPINTRFDLYSMGKDGLTTIALTAKNSRDDIVVANDGGFVGLASRY